MEALAKLCSVAAAQEKGGPIVSALFLCAQTGDSEVRTLCEEMLAEAAKPIQEMVEAWMSEGGQEKICWKLDVRK